MSQKAIIEERQIHEATQEIINLMLKFDDEARRRIFRTASTFYALDVSNQSPMAIRHHLPTPMATDSRTPNFTSHSELSAKDFLFQKMPRTDIERIACLAYYLTHYRSTKHFKTIDLSKLNTEAAQIKFSNAAFTVVNAANAGLLAAAGKGNKQISALGERYVEALPDRDKAKEVLAYKTVRRARKTLKSEVQSD